MSFDICRTKNDLIKQLAELKGDLLTLRVQKIAGGSAAKLTKMFVPPFNFTWDTEMLTVWRVRILTSSNAVRKSIARVLTVTNQKSRQHLREFYKKKKYLPLDLRPKKTRAIRRRLTTVRPCCPSPRSICNTLTTLPLLAREKAEDNKATQEGHPLPQEEVRRESGLNH